MSNEILIIEDSPTQAQQIEMLLESDGYHVAIGSTGLQGLQMAREMLPELIILDVNLPDLDGFEVCRRLRQQLNTPYIPILILTVRQAVDDIVDGLELGANDYLPKPFDERELLARVKALLRIKRLEEELQKAHDKLEVKVKERTAELAQANKHLKEQIAERERVDRERQDLLNELTKKTRELEQIVYVVSHDLRSPLVNVQGFSKELEYALQEVAALLRSEEVPDGVREKVLAIFEEDISRALDYILTNIAKMAALFSGLLKLLRLGHTMLTITALDMNKLLAEVIGALAFQINDADVSFEISELPPCKGDAVQLSQVFAYILDNAFKYLDPCRPGLIKIWGSHQGNQSVYCVEDNGIGIAPEYHQKIFEIFYQLNPAKSSGEGLGLTIVERILDSLGGKIWLESEPGAGSKFYVSLPRVMEEWRNGGMA